MGNNIFKTMLIGVFTLMLGTAFAQAPAGLPEGHPDISGKEMPADHGMPDFDVELVGRLAYDVAVVKGTLGGEVDLLFYSLFAAAEEQGLFNEETAVGAVFPFAMEKGWDENTEIYAAITLAEGMEVKEPLFRYTVPAAEYLVVMNIGPYEESEATWIAAFEWAEGHGIEFAKAPALEHYLDDPEEVLAEELRCRIFIPVVPGQGHEGMDAGMHDGHKMPEGHGAHHGMDMGQMEGAPDFMVMVETIAEPVYMAYVEGVAGDDYEVKIMEAIGAAATQGLLEDPEVKVGTIYPLAMSEGYSETTPVYFGIGLEHAPDVEAPLDIFEMPLGEYLMVEHIGPYAEIGNTWDKAFKWATEHGIEFGTGPCGEVYISDPHSTPEAELISLIFIPLVAGQAHGMDHPGYTGGGHDMDKAHGDDHDGGGVHGDDNDEEDDPHAGHGHGKGEHPQ